MTLEEYATRQKGPTEVERRIMELELELWAEDPRNDPAWYKRQVWEHNRPILAMIAGLKEERNGADR